LAERWSPKPEVVGSSPTLAAIHRIIIMAYTGPQWFAADLHFEHPGIVKEREGGRRNRPFATVEEHDEAVIANWNAVVGVNDKVYVLGDVCMKPAGLPKMARLNGKKHLVKGNHDIFELEEYAKYFYQVSACRVFQKETEGFLATHMPVHPMELPRFKFNVHGHLHGAQVMLEEELWGNKPDDRYLCVSLERTNYAPIHMDQVLAAKARMGCGQ
jgi:calcineurin-like phosphoesterase family protein